MLHLWANLSYPLFITNVLRMLLQTVLFMTQAGEVCVTAFLLQNWIFHKRLQFSLLYGIFYIPLLRNEIEGANGWQRLLRKTQAKLGKRNGTSFDLTMVGIKPGSHDYQSDAQPIELQGPTATVQLSMPHMNVTVKTIAVVDASFPAEQSTTAATRKSSHVLLPAQHCPVLSREQEVCPSVRLVCFSSLITLTFTLPSF